MFKSRKMGWAGHVTPMGEIRNAYKNLSEKLKVNNHVERRILLLLFILTANGFLPGGSRTTIRHNTQITQNTQNNTTIKRNTGHKSTHTLHTLHKMNKRSLEYDNHNYHYIK
jgi:hypothetical protein